MNILFICTGNMTRSPLAEAVLKKKLKDAGLEDIHVSSAGTLASDNNHRDATMIKVAKDHGYTIDGLTRKVDYSTGTESDLIFCMEPYHADYMKGLLGAFYHTRIHLLMQWALNSHGVIYDPTCKSLDCYQDTLGIIETVCDAMVLRIKDMTSNR